MVKYVVSSRDVEEIVAIPTSDYAIYMVRPLISLLSVVTELRINRIAAAKTETEETKTVTSNFLSNAGISVVTFRCREHQNPTANYAHVCPSDMFSKLPPRFEDRINGNPNSRM